MFFTPSATEGPFTTASSSDIAYCKKFWWQNLLFINNVVTKDIMNSCYPISWYLAMVRRRRRRRK